MSFLIASAAKEKNCSQLISPGSFLSPITHRNSWHSSFGDFEFGFYKQGSRYAIGIWLANCNETTVVWTANRDDPLVAVNAMLVFTDYGKLVLTTEQGLERLIANATHPASFACMHDSGNFVLYNEKFDVVWQSFEHPTDSMLGGQILPVRGQLFSSLSETDHSTGRFHLKMQDDGNLVLYPVNTIDSSSDAHWSTTTFGAGYNFHLFLSSTGLLSLINTTNSERVYDLNDMSTSDNNQNSSIYRATLDADGVFRLYSHARDEDGKLQAPIRIWSALENPCEVKGSCGLNSYCTYYDAQPNCMCLPGTDFADLRSRTSGCLRNYTEMGCRDGKENASFYYMTRMENMMWGDMPYAKEQTSLEECSKSCLEDCNCGAALFDYKARACTKQKHPLIYVRRDIREQTSAFLKVGSRSSVKSRNETEPVKVVKPPTVTMITNKKALVQIVVLASGFILFSCVALAISGIYVFKIRVLRYKS
ncbi:hypothetical protein TIFTF001_016199 [Ficus carica]|uniref:Bulb-type lectin domain-containing protein n=1 Tax=Ficus carica TaxID=3494 RepID=A0AA88DIT0_FICCA|nr:hypothetical protein TIFTF001_016199 [Ficus carica]